MTTDMGLMLIAGGKNMSYENFNRSVKYCIQIQDKEDNDVFAAVTGAKSAGKSSFSLQHATRIVRERFGENELSLHKYIAYNNKEIMDKMYNLKKYSPLIADEGIRIMWSREWNKSVFFLSPASQLALWLCWF